jgi:3-deoxy-D-manno-octulosonate 8-phosphate phosphatase (KDO 8-P phosphatase)
MISEKLKNIKLLLLDVDGVLTDGSIIYNDNNEETKTFNVKDGFGIRLLMDAGIEVGIVTGRASKALIHRCNNLGLSLIFDGVVDKSAIFDKIMEETGLSEYEIAFIGDDLPDLPLLKKAGLSIAVSDAHEVVRSNVDLVTSAKGGNGAVREICEAILKAGGLWDEILKKYL